MSILPERPPCVDALPPGPALPAVLDGAAALAVPTATGYRVQLLGQTSWVLCDRENPNLVLLELDAQGGPQR